MKWRLALFGARVSAVTAAAVTLGAGWAAYPAALAAAGGPAAAVAGRVHFENRSLGSVWCAGRSFCMGVGNFGAQVSDNTTFSQVWNGRTWQAMTVPEPAGADFGLNGVACTSARSCLAVGSQGAPQSELADAWNGKSWRMLPALAGVPFPSLNGVACPAVNDCIAVGLTGLSPSSVALAERWNGKSWTQLAPASAPAGAASSEFSGISCAGPDYCVAVGQYVQGVRGFSHPLAESWNGTAWTLLPSAPAGLTGFGAVSCPVASACVAVGSGPGLAMGSAVWNGTSWAALAMQDPTTSLQSHPSLTGVSCTSATSCIAVGAGAEDAPFAEQWSGGPAWQRLPVPKLDYNGFSSVSCPGPADCIAVGGAGEGNFGLSVDSSLATAWNGKTWSVLRTSKVDQLSGVACARAGRCLMTGGYLDPADVTRTLAESWNGKRVRLVSPHGLIAIFGPVSCPSASFCMTIENGTFAIWNGKHWTWSTVPGDFISFLSCASRNFCAGGPSGQVWNGKTWRGASFAQPGGPNLTALIAAVSCPRPDFCMAGGSWEQDFESGSITGSLANVWNGSAWKLIPGPFTGGTLTAVSCLSSVNCWVTGTAATQFAARWNGRDWKVYNLPDPSGAAPSSISCPTTASCVAVAGAPANVAFVWNGRTWRRAKIGGPAGLTTVSCATPSQCIAVGNPDASTLADIWNGKTWRQLKTVNP